MGTGAFRDTSAAIARVAALTDENERLKTEIAELRTQIEVLEETHDGSKAVQETRRLTKERQALRDELEQLRIANIAAVNRMKTELKDQKRGLEQMVLDLETERDALQSELEVHRRGLTTRDEQLVAIQTANADVQRLTRERDTLVKTSNADIERLTKERDTLMKKLRDKDAEDAFVGEGNGNAFLQRVIEERDELSRDLRTLREEKERAKGQGDKGVLKRLSRIFR